MSAPEDGKWGRCEGVIDYPGHVAIHAPKERNKRDDAFITWTEQHMDQPVVLLYMTPEQETKLLENQAKLKALVEENNQLKAKLAQLADKPSWDRDTKLLSGGKK